MVNSKEKMKLEIIKNDGSKLVYIENEDYTFGDLLLQAEKAREQGYEAHFK